MTFSFEKLWDKFSGVAGWNNFTVTQIYIFTGITVAGFLIEMAFTGWQNSSLKRLLHPGKSERTDIIMWLMGMFNLNRIIGVLFSFGICYYAVGLVSKHFHFNLIVKISSPLLQVVLLLLIGDLKNYVRHYFSHNLSPIWMAHQFHHSAEEFTMLTHHRNHFVENAFGMLFDVIPFVLLGSSPQSFFLIAALHDLHQMLVHGRWRSNWGFVGNYILVSPDAHRVHHSVSEKHYGKNYGSLFIFWDRIFNTYQAPVPVPEIGLPGAGFNERGFLYDFWQGYANVWRRFMYVFRRRN